MSSIKSTHFDEFKMIKEHLSPLSLGEGGAYGLSDDAAKLNIEKGNIVLTTDAIIEGVHFPKSEDPKILASRIIRVNLSDIAAMGAVPRAYLLVLALPSSTTLKWIESFVEGLSDEQKEFSISLIGGDTTHTHSELMLSITMIGEIYDNNILLRSGARIGDYIYVSGFIGDAALGLSLIQGHYKSNNISITDYLVNRFRKPTPRIDLGKGLNGIANSAADVSDGLLADLNNIILSSKCGARIYLKNIPFTKQTKKLLNLKKIDVNYLLTCGEDYQLIFTARKNNSKKIFSIAKKNFIKITKVGSIIKKKKLIVLNKNNEELLFNNLGFKHF